MNPMMNPMTHRPALSALALLTAVALPIAIAPKALAHAVETDYLLTGESLLEFQSRYSTGEPMQGATVEIYAPNNPEEPWIQLTTDEEGRFAFTPDDSIQGDWEVVIKQEGHGDIWTVPVGETGIDLQNISLDTAKDVHYAASPLMMVGAGAIAIAAAGLALRREPGR